MSRFQVCHRAVFARGMLAVAAIAAVSAQQQRQVPSERGTSLLSVTFAAVTNDGTPVSRLTADDVSIKIDGRSRRVRSLQLVSMANAVRGAGSPLAPPFGSNAVTNHGRSILLMVDDESFIAGGEQALRAAGDRLLASVSADDRIAVATIPHGGVNVASTGDRAKIRTALATLVGRGDARQTGSDFACRTRLTLEALARHLRTLRTPEAPSIVALLTAGLAAPRRDAPQTMAPGVCELRLDAFREVAEAAGRARAQFYVVPPVDIMSTGSMLRENIAGVGVQGSDNPVEGIEQLLGVTGGKLLNVGTGERTAFDRIVSETSAYYVAAIDPQRSDAGRAHALEVSVAKADVEIRSARSITFADPDERAAASSSPSPRDMLSTMEVFRDLPLRAAAYSSFEEPNGNVRVLTLAEPMEPDVKLASMMAALFDRDGKGIASWVAQPPDLARTPLIGALSAPRGAYRLRVAAIDAAGRTGTADYDVDVDLAQSGPMKISSVLLGLSRGGAFVPRLQFIAEPVAIGYVEMSGASAGSKVTAILELADAANAPARIAVPLSIEPGANGRYVGKGALPIGALPAGDYVVRAMVGLDDHPMTRVIRTLRKAIPAER